MSLSVLIAHVGKFEDDLEDDKTEEEASAEQIEDGAVLSGGKTPAPESKGKSQPNDESDDDSEIETMEVDEDEDESDEESSEESEEDDEESSSEEESEDENVKPNKRGAKKSTGAKLRKMDVKDMKVSELRNELKKLGLDVESKGAATTATRKLK